MKAGILRVAALGAVLALSSLGLSPASACLRTHAVHFAPGDTEVREAAAIADFLQIRSWGARQKIVVRVSGPDGDLARRRVGTLADLLVSYGIASSGIMLESDRADQERAVLIVYPPPHVVPIPGAAADASAGSPPARRCGSQAIG